jgi:hypothetical protein
MKTLKYSAALFCLFVGAQLLTACSGYIVATGPPPPRTEIILVAPSPRYVWTPGYYTYTRGTYVFVDGSYQIPPRGRTSYIQGEWHNNGKGYKRSKGRWN